MTEPSERITVNPDGLLRLADALEKAAPEKNDDVVQGAFLAGWQACVEAMRSVARAAGRPT